MQPSKLQLEQYFVEEVSFRLKESVMSKINGEPVLEPSDMDIEVHLGEHKDEPSRLYCQLDVKLSKDTVRQFPYAFKIVMVGFFQLSSESTVQEKEVLMSNAAPSMLYTAAREYLLTITGRTRYYPIKLPTILFIPKERGRTRKESKAKKSAPNRSAKPRAKKAVTN